MNTSKICGVYIDTRSVLTAETSVKNNDHTTTAMLIIYNVVLIACSANSRLLSSAAQSCRVGGCFVACSPIIFNETDNRTSRSIITVAWAELLVTTYNYGAIYKRGGIVQISLDNTQLYMDERRA